MEECQRQFGSAAFFSAAEIADIGAARKFIFVYGRAEYRDAFRRKRHTNFRLAYGGPFPPAQNVGMSFTQWGNDAK